jgi:hypothetical protein
MFASGHLRLPAQAENCATWIALYGRVSVPAPSTAPQSLIGVPGH